MYHPFHSFFLRTPHSPFNSLKEEPFEAKIRSKQVQEAIYIASPVLYAELQKQLDGTITDKEEKQQIESSVYRYISRMSSRSTPFGLFAGCSTGLIDGDTTYISIKRFNRTTRLDMYFLCTLSQELSKLPEIKEKVRYYPNTTLYPLGKKYRYVEYQYINSKRIHKVSSVDRTVYLDALLKTARKGASINELLSCLIEREIEPEEARSFIEELIDSQIIVSELSPSVTGDDYFSQMIHILKKLNISEGLLSALDAIQETLQKMDLPPNPLKGENGSDVDNHAAAKYPLGDLGVGYQQIINKIKEIKIPYEEKFLFQVDMTRNVSEATLGKDIIDELQSALVFLNKITLGGGNETLNQFQQAFYSRYEDREILLLEALDPEIGIGYPVNRGAGNLSPLLENFPVPGNQSTGSQSSNFLSNLSKKVLDVHQNEIILSDEDVKNFKSNSDDLPVTIHSMFEIIKIGSTPLIYLTGFAGISGAKLLPSHRDSPEISGLVQSRIPALHSNRLYLLWSLLHLKKTTGLDIWNEQMDILANHIDYKKIIQNELRNKDVFIHDGVAGIYLLLNTINNASLSLPFDKVIILKRIQESEIWKDEGALKDMGLINGFSGLLWVYYLIIN